MSSLFPCAWGAPSSSAPPVAEPAFFAPFSPGPLPSAELVPQRSAPAYLARSPCLISCPACPHGAHSPLSQHLRLAYAIQPLFFFYSPLFDAIPSKNLFPLVVITSLAAIHPSTFLFGLTPPFVSKGQDGKMIPISDRAFPLPQLSLRGSHRFRLLAFRQCSRKTPPSDVRCTF